jgi:DNA integrity scanning protein DisA with diadenylate cyclase activity
MNRISEAMYQHAAALARDIGADAVMFDADAVESIDELEELLARTDFRTVVLVGEEADIKFDRPEHVTFLPVPSVPLNRVGQIKMAVVMGVAEKLFERSDVLVCLSGVQNSGRLDMLAVIRVGEEPEFFLTDEANPVPPDVKPAVFEKVLSLVSELAAEGRERRPVGAIFVVGDSEAVLENSRQLIFNPFHGYPEEQRNILSGELDETIKEFAAIDGAFIIRGDGVLLAAGRYLMPKGKPAEPLRAGLGTRHEAAAAITAVTDAVAVALSQSTSTITIFNSGRMLTEIEKIRSGSDRWSQTRTRSADGG